MEINLKNVIEAALMVCNKAMNIERIQSLFVDSSYQPSQQDILQVIAELKEDYADRGLELIEVKSGYRFQTRQEVAHWVNHLWEEKPTRYSRATLETLALIAYRQPITRSEIEDVRGVSVSTNIIRTLEERSWVRVVGHKDLPGRPAMFATTTQFLEDFNLKGLEDLPSLMDVRDLDKIQQELFGDENQTIVTSDEPEVTELEINQSIDEAKIEVVDAETEAMETDTEEQSPLTAEIIHYNEPNGVDESLAEAEELVQLSGVIPETVFSGDEAGPALHDLQVIEGEMDSSTSELYVRSDDQDLYQTPDESEERASTDNSDEEIERAIDEVFEHFDDDEVVEFKELDFAMPEFHAVEDTEEECEESEDFTKHGFQEVDDPNDTSVEEDVKPLGETNQLKS